MPHRTIARRTALAAFTMLTMCAMLAVAQPAIAQNAVAIVVNGAQMQFNQPPVERGGRIFVPPRGVFERLGATVVYDNGQINATGNGRNISLHLGSNQATVDGQTQTLDVAPFLVGASTLVPLRFIAQALGASVDWNNATSTVTISGSGNNNGNNYNNRNQQNRPFYLSNQTPINSINSQSPAMHATYSEPINGNSLRVSIDGRDVTGDVYGNASGFNLKPSFALGAGTHQVTVTGTTQAGAPFSTGWNFQTARTAPSATNYLRGVEPANGSNVGPNFIISGHTIPGSHVRIIAGSFLTTTQADRSGAFNATVGLRNARGSQVRVIVQSIAPNGSSTESSYTYIM